VYDISKEECNNIIEKLNDTKVKQKNFEPTKAPMVNATRVMKMRHVNLLEIKALRSFNF
jgi:hypothetical protein